MCRLLWAIIAALSSEFGSRQGLVLENLALRQQLATVVQKQRPVIGPADRLFWLSLRRVWPRWADTLVIVKPETVIAWHRAGFPCTGDGSPRRTCSLDGQRLAGRSETSCGAWPRRTAGVLHGFTESCRSSGSASRNAPCRGTRDRTAVDRSRGRAGLRSCGTTGSCSSPWTSSWCRQRRSACCASGSRSGIPGVRSHTGASPPGKLGGAVGMPWNLGAGPDDGIVPPFNGVVPLAGQSRCRHEEIGGRGGTGRGSHLLACQALRCRALRHGDRSRG